MGRNLLLRKEGSRLTRTVSKVLEGEHDPPGSSQLPWACLMAQENIKPLPSCLSDLSMATMIFTANNAFSLMTPSLEIAEDLSIPGKRTTFKCFLGCIERSQIFSWETYIKLKNGIILCPEQAEGVMVWIVGHGRWWLKTRGCLADRLWGKGARLTPPVMSETIISHPNKMWQERDFTWAVFSKIHSPVWPREKHQTHQSWRTCYKIPELTRPWKRWKDPETVPG